MVDGTSLTANGVNSCDFCHQPDSSYAGKHHLESPATGKQGQSGSGFDRRYCERLLAAERERKEPSLRHFFAGLALLLLAGCVGSGMPVRGNGELRLAEVERQMGPPAMRWQTPGGGETHWFIRVSDGIPDLFRTRRCRRPFPATGRRTLCCIFSRIQAGMTPEEVMRVIGPPGSGMDRLFQGARRTGLGMALLR